MSKPRKKVRLKPEDLQLQIAQAVDELSQLTDLARFNDQFKDYMTVLSRFHHYSLGNCFSIAIHQPGATVVAGFRKWKSLGRTVKKGEKGIPILIPLFRKVDPNDPDSEELYAFGTGYVFDVSQTEGDPLPEPPNWKSPEKSAELLAAVTAYCQEQNINFNIRDLPGETQGLAVGRMIQLSSMAGIKTAFHELAHVLLGHSERIWLSTRQKETEAEAIAYVVARHFGIEELASPNYLALHGSTSEYISRSLEVVQKTAHALIGGIENCLQTQEHAPVAGLATEFA
jgi:hypothetical protein